ncbi:hypothetical protein L21SP5_00621 [Salinivirga cyanobacteriivorans]|uniref:Uncharacterized protein n=1 Tax=Salinivirga cyanobacteriivorans TaxID=1307839 RepID=A0A0S2HWC4_9BACT|nr:hypothetical protein L21SP5_00621 [Salinivirga cyanobacteriivorans]
MPKLGAPLHKTGGAFFTSAVNRRANYLTIRKSLLILEWNYVIPHFWGVMENKY